MRRIPPKKVNLFELPPHVQCALCLFYFWGVGCCLQNTNKNTLLLFPDKVDKMQLQKKTSYRHLKHEKCLLLVERNVSVNGIHYYGNENSVENGILFLFGSITEIQELKFNDSF